MITVSEKRCATLPNCDGCGRFTSNPEVDHWCIDGGDYHACYEELLCPTCSAKQKTVTVAGEATP